MGDPLDIGQEFALRWAAQNHPVQAPRRKAAIDPYDFCQEVANAVNTYADKKRAELESALKRLVKNALAENNDPFDVRVSPDDLLKSQEMQIAGTRVVDSGVERARRFPVRLHT